MHNGNFKYFKSPIEYIRLFPSMVKAMRVMGTAEFKKAISPTFLERIALAISGVSNCAYCSWLHTKTSLEKGMNEKEIKKILDGDIDDVTEDEAIALFYVQHRADSGGNFSLQARQRAVNYYGETKVQYIDHAFHAVFFGNLCSNTVYSVKNNLMQRRKGIKMRIVYLLSVPVANHIKKGSGN